MKQISTAPIIPIRTDMFVIDGTAKLRKDGQRKRSGGKQSDGSKLVYPIKESENVKAFIEYFYKKTQEDTNDNTVFINTRNYLMIILGMNTAFRVSDLIKLQWIDVFNEEGQFQEGRRVREKKTRKYREVFLNQVVKDAFELYLASDAVKRVLKHKTNHVEPLLTDYVFIGGGKNPHIDDDTIRKMIKKAAKEVGICYNVGTHTMRKTFVYHTIMNNREDATILYMLMRMLNHSSPDITLSYATITHDEMYGIYNDIGHIYSRMLQ